MEPFVFSVMEAISPELIIPSMQWQYKNLLLSAVEDWQLSLSQSDGVSRGTLLFIMTVNPYESTKKERS